jgi:hypothetical protein
MSLSWAHSTPLLYETVRSNGVNGTAPSPILSLERGIDRGCERLH